MNARGTRGYYTDQPIRVTGRFAQVTVNGDGSTTKGFFNSVSATATAQIPLSFQGTSVGLFSLDPRLLTMSALYSQWRVRELTFEFVETQGSTKGLAFGICEDDAANFTNTFTNTIMMECSRVLNIGAIPPQKMTWRPSRNRDWLFVTNASQTTEASRRETSHGNMVGLWDVAPTANTYGYIVVHYDILFRSEIPSQTVNLPAIVREKMNEKNSPAKLDEEYLLVRNEQPVFDRSGNISASTQQVRREIERDTPRLALARTSGPLLGPAR